MPLELAKRLKDAMAARSLKQAELARLSGIDPAYLSLLASGKRSNPSFETVFKLVAALGVTRDWLLTGKEPMDATDEQKALARSRLAGGVQISNSVNEDAASYGYSRPPAADKVMREILQRLDDASLSSDELDKDLLHRRLDEFFEVLEKAKQRVL